jgi:hypothetical protein
MRVRRALVMVAWGALDCHPLLIHCTETPKSMAHLPGIGQVHRVNSLEIVYRRLWFVLVPQGEVSLSSIAWVSFLKSLLPFVFSGSGRGVEWTNRGPPVRQRFLQTPRVVRRKWGPH